MLVLTRKPGERILIDGHIVLTVTKAYQGRVRIGVDAPRDTKILRGELVSHEPPAVK